MAGSAGFMGWLENVVSAIQKWAGQPASAAKRDDSMTEAAATFRWPEHEDHLDVVGEQFYQSNLERLVGDHGSKSVRLEVTAVIRPEDDNPHDDRAVGIWIDGYKVGHLGRDDARSFRRRLSSKKMSNQITACSAIVMGGFIRANGERASYGVQLFIKPFM